LENLNQELNSKINILKEEAIYLNEQVTKLTLEAEGNPPISQYPSLNTIVVVVASLTMLPPLQTRGAVPLRPCIVISFVCEKESAQWTEKKK